MRARPRTILTPAQAHELAAGFIAARRALHGDATMTAGTGEQQQAEQAGDGEGLTQEEQDQVISDQVARETGDSGQRPAKYSQEDYDRLAAKLDEKFRVKYEKRLVEAQELAGKSEVEKYQIERDQAQQRAQEATQKAAERVAKTEAKVAAIAAGANPERLAAIVRNADLAAAVKDGEVDEAAVKAAVEKVLTEYPEWKKTTGTGPSASGGELNGGGNGKPTFTRKQLDEMPPDEMAARIDEINEAIADGRITG